MSTVITARDFNPDTTDKLRDRWTGATMGAVVKAVGGKTVAITTDTHTGSTMMGVTLHAISVRGGNPYVLIKGGLNDQGVWYPVYDCGMVLPLEEEIGKGGKWTALDIYREEQCAAMAAASTYAQSEAGGGRTCGAYKASPMAHGGQYHVTYEPSQSAPADKNPGSKLVVSVTVNDGEARVNGVVADYSAMDRLRVEHEARMVEINRYREAGKTVPAHLLARRPRASARR